MLKWWLGVVAFACGLAFGFPENVRHGYVNCTACHIGPNGGGVLTPYGRSLSRELVSTWGSEGESDFLYGAVRTPPWLNLGGDLRAVQLVKDTRTSLSGKFLFMQADLEAAVGYFPGWQIVATVGRSSNRNPTSLSETLLSRRHYVQFQATPQFAVRAGRFNQAYGLNLPDHAIAIRRGIGWDQSSETYNAELSWIDENLEGFATLVTGRPDAPSLDKERGVALRCGVALGGRSRVGLSYFNGNSDKLTRNTFGPYAAIGLSEKLVLLAELDFVDITSKVGQGTSLGVASYAKVDYEVFKGWHTYVIHELSRAELRSPEGQTNVYGVGLQIFPRPHLEVNLAYQRQRNLNVSPDFINVTSAMLHFYP